MRIRGGLIGESQGKKGQEREIPGQDALSGDTLGGKKE